MVILLRAKIRISAGILNKLIHIIRINRVFEHAGGVFSQFNGRFGVINGDLVKVLIIREIHINFDNHFHFPPSP